jgi:hypothetical protein
VHPDPEIRKTADYFQQKTTELRALNRSVEDTIAVAASPSWITYRIFRTFRIDGFF